MSFFEHEPLVMKWDTEHFGIKIARFSPSKVSDVLESVKWAHDNGIELLMSRSDASISPLTLAQQRAGFELMDSFVQYRFDFAKSDIPESVSEFSIRPFRPEDIPDIGKVASVCFKGYISHLHNDPLLDKQKCDSLYEGWAMNSCKDKTLADEVLVAANGNGEIVGFATLKGSDSDIAESILVGVSNEYQGRGIYRSFIIHGMQWCKSNGFRTMKVDTQVYHYAVQRVWQRLGFEIFASGHTFHLWVDGQDA